jgi:uncharacterized protein (DUF362 family)
MTADNEPRRLGRRAFLSAAGGVAAAAALSQACWLSGADGVEVVTDGPPSPQPAATASQAVAISTSIPSPTPASLVGRVALIRTGDRAGGVQRLLDLWGENAVNGKRVFLKPNLNSADAAPGSTHLDTLRALVERLWAMGATSIQLGERSGMGETRTVMRSLGVADLAAEQGMAIEVFDDLPADGWIAMAAPGGSHWSLGFAIARPCLEAEVVVQTCNLKTHRFGGHFTLSLKNSVGMAARRIPGEAHDYMTELHNSPHQRAMIADLNASYSPGLILLDGVEAFRDGGPDKGTKVDAHVMLAGVDRIAVDAVGVAILRDLGTTPEVARGRVFDQEQIARAVELGLGVAEPQQIDLLTDDPAGREFADRLRVLLEGEGA